MRTSVGSPLAGRPGRSRWWQEQVVRENQQAAELLPLRAQLELSRAPALDIDGGI